MAYSTKLIDGVEHAYKDYNYTYMGVERTSHVHARTDMWTIGGVVDSAGLEAELDQQIESFKHLCESIDGHLDPLTEPALCIFEGSGAS